MPVAGTKIRVVERLRHENVWEWTHSKFRQRYRDLPTAKPWGQIGEKEFWRFMGPEDLVLVRNRSGRRNSLRTASWTSGKANRLSLYMLQTGMECCSVVPEMSHNNAIGREGLVGAESARMMFATGVVTARDQSMQSADKATNGCSKQAGRQVGIDR